MSVGEGWDPARFRILPSSAPHQRGLLIKPLQELVGALGQRSHRSVPDQVWPLKGSRRFWSRELQRRGSREATLCPDNDHTVVVCADIYPVIVMNSRANLPCSRQRPCRGSCTLMHGRHLECARQLQATSLKHGELSEAVTSAAGSDYVTLSKHAAKGWAECRRVALLSAAATLSLMVSLRDAGLLLLGELPPICRTLPTGRLRWMVPPICRLRGQGCRHGCPEI